MKKFVLMAAVVVCLLGFGKVGYGQCVSLTTMGSASTQNFDTLSNTAGSTTNNLTIPGWFLTESGGGLRDNEQYGVDTGASTTGDTYSYGAAGSTERALGSLRSGTLIPLFGACYTNNTGATIGSLGIAYNGEEWRLGTAARTDQLTFEYSTNATDLVTGAWTNVAALNFVTPDTATTGAKNGNAAADRTALSSTISNLSIANGATFWIRFNDIDASGADDGLAIDDFSLTPQAFVPPTNLSINDVSAPEGNAGTTSFTFTVSLSAPAGAGGVTFDIATADGTATTGDSDYVQNSINGLSIPAGQMSNTFTVLVNGDATQENNETFFVNVTNVTGTGVVVTDGQGQGTIQNDDAPPSFSIDDVTAAEGNSGTTNFTFTITKTGATAMSSSVQADTADGTATAGTDYASNSQTFTFLFNETTKSFTVTVNGDTTVEPDETFFVNLTNASNATVADAQGVGTIQNDDVATPPVISLTSTVVEDDESQTLAVVIGRTGDTSGTSTVEIKTDFAQTVVGLGNSSATPGAACTAGVDYIPQNGTVTFMPGDAEKTVFIPTCGDAMTEPNEFFPITISNPTNATLGMDISADGIIDDAASQYVISDPITIGSGTTSNPYPATMVVANAPQTITGLRVTLFDFQHIGSENLDVLLVGPQGQKFLLMGDAGGNDGLDTPATITFDDMAGQVLPDSSVIESGRYEPTTWEPNQTSFPEPAPAGPYIEPGSAVGGPITLTSTFGGINPNGSWQLYVRDDNGAFAPMGINGTINGGWGIQFLAPSAAGVSVSGQVRAGRSGLPNTTVMISGGGLAQPRITRTNSFGNYRFDDLEAGQAYVVTVVSYRYSFAQPSIVVNLDDNLENADFVADER
ncbi:MAG: hypothetical protein JSS81_25230 [Acidobacteria bacterium]|nr:hypothetical protein [Acidobacteriota bacterium]